MAPPRTPGTRMALAARILHAHASQLEATGQAAYVLHRRESGRPGNVLAAVRRVLRGRATARWHLAPWPRNAPSNVLIVEQREEVA
jgi:hypothetical protein